MNITLILIGFFGATVGAGGMWLWLRGRAAGVEMKLGLVQQRLDELLVRVEAEQNEKGKLLGLVGQLEAAKSALEVQLATEKEQLVALHGQLAVGFEQVATKVAHGVMEAKVQQMKQLNAESVGQLVTPLREQLEGFRKQVTEAYGTENEKRAALGAKVEELMKATVMIQGKADALTQALTNNVKTQGNWGETILEQVLAASGLRAGEEYVLQKHVRGADGQNYYLDALVNLPDGKQLVVDAKVSLVSYVALSNAVDEVGRVAAQKDFVASVRAHIKGLSEKNYAALLGGMSPDFTVLFMPVEGALLTALQADEALWTYAWDKRIALAGPGTLFPILRTAASLWQIEKQNKNAQEIAETAGKLSDKLVGMVEDIEKVRRALKTADTAVDDLGTKFSGRGGVENMLGRMKGLGAKGTKQVEVKEEVGLL